MNGDTAWAGHRPDASAMVIEQEYESVLAAILLVASGRSPRVTVANLRFADRLLPRLDPIAAERMVRLAPIWSVDEDGPHDIVVEPATS